MPDARSGRVGTGRPRPRRRDLAGPAAGALLLALGGWTYADSGATLSADVGDVPVAAPGPTGPSPRPVPPVVREAPAPPAPAAAATATATAAAPARRAVVVEPGSVATLRPEPRWFAPTGVSVPVIDAEARVVPVAVADGALGVPPDPAVLGWWEAGGKPGNGIGTVVIDGHVDSAHYGAGPLRRAAELRPGDEATLTGAGGASRRYVVQAVRTYVKAELPAAELFRTGGPERLLIVTCGGEFRRAQGRWDSNVVVFLAPG